MNVEITGRQLEITPALRDFAEDKLRKIERLLDGPVEAHLVLAIEKHRHVAEIKIKSRTAVLSGTQETGDLYASIGEVVDKLERQALKHKEKMHDHKHRKSPRDPQVAAEIAENAKPEGPEEIAHRGPARIVRSGNFVLKPLSPEDAVLKLEISGEPLLVYRDAETERLNVVYRRSDGDFGLVDPEF